MKLDWIRKYFVLLCIILSISACSDYKKKNEVIKYINEYSNSMIKEQYENSWNMLSKRLQFGNDNDKKEYVRYIKQHGFHMQSFKINSLVINEKSAVATVKSNYVESNGASVGSAIEEWTFIEEEGHWRFDHSRTLSESAN